MFPREEPIFLRIEGYRGAPKTLPSESEPGKSLSAGRRHRAGIASGRAQGWLCTRAAWAGTARLSWAGTRTSAVEPRKKRNRAGTKSTAGSRRLLRAGCWFAAQTALHTHRGVMPENHPRTGGRPPEPHCSVCKTVHCSPPFLTHSVLRPRKQAGLHTAVLSRQAQRGPRSHRLWTRR